MTNLNENNEDMRTMRLCAFFTVLMAITLISCGGKSSEEQAEEWLDKAEALAERGEYAEALAAIDSLRAKYPNEIAARKAGLRLHQEISLEQAQKTIGVTDSTLQAVMNEWQSAKTQLDNLRKRGDATDSELKEALTKVATLRERRDSLQVVIDVECAKVKYIKARMKE